MTTYDAIIIGAGLSGLTSAYYLKKQGYRVLILEAQARVGGRVHSVNYHNFCIDLGAQWINPNQKRMQALINEFGLTLVPTYKKGNTLYDFMGKRMMTKRNAPPFSFYSLYDLYTMLKKMKKLYKHVPTDRPWNGKDAIKHDSVTMNGIIDEMKSKVGKSFFRTVLEESLCNDLTEVSLLDILWNVQSAGGFQEILKGEDFWIKEGAQELVTRIANKLTSDLLLDTPAEKVEWTKNEVYIYSQRQTFKAKRAIITLPIPLASRLNYHPALPAIRDQFTQRVGQSAVIKCIVVYDNPFWRKAKLNGNAYMDQGYVHTTFDSSHPNQKEGILTALICSKYARDLGSKSPSIRQKLVLMDLEYLFGEKAGKPLYYFEKDWTEDAWSRGGYGAHLAPGVITQFQHAMMEPIGPLHWAGSETATEWRLYMEGAVQSGERAALEVIQSIQ
ncbi:flavin monoamine oxidase family protein [Bacillus sp. FJAT-45350]|uniref:flavin monoamine oxidase family protein n=1 Tax=Bacillus sp. FJAT-45350 TaxID=2011014 RepID=UPI0015CC6860|nr:FAD-dependent oxidoreductase [Bacillus sp. FJAT-45350]